MWSLLIAVGVGIGLYPAVQRLRCRLRQEDLIERFLQRDPSLEAELEGQEVLGVLWIPKVECKLLILAGTDEKALELGAGLLEGSSPLTDGAAVHTVLCAHSGLPQLYAFDRIDELAAGDPVYVVSHDLILMYRVTDQSTVLPEEVHLLLQPSQFANEITLLTCTPYGINTHRLLVRAELSRSLGGSAA